MVITSRSLSSASSSFLPNQKNKMNKNGKKKILDLSHLAKVVGRSNAESSSEPSMMMKDDSDRNKIKMNIVGSKNVDSSYPSLPDPKFTLKISKNSNFDGTQYDGTVDDVKKMAEMIDSKSRFEIAPHQAFVRNFMSVHSPYNSLLLYHQLGTGKTYSAISVAEDSRQYAKLMGLPNKRIYIIATPLIQEHFRSQIFNEDHLEKSEKDGGVWTVKGRIGKQFLKEIDATDLDKNEIIRKVEKIIDAAYSFMSYQEFSNFILKTAGDDATSRKRNLEKEFQNALIIVDEVHNIRLSGDNESKNVAKNLMYLVGVVDNIRLLLLTATPMFSNFKEIIWLINLMNMNDRRSTIRIEDVFGSNGEFLVNNDGEEVGKKLLAQKMIGYVSYVRGGNPYTFPFAVYPTLFEPECTFQSLSEYPKYQPNCKMIPKENKINKLQLYLTSVGHYQEMCYMYIVDHLRKLNRMENNEEGSSDEIASFAYTALQTPIECLIMSYPFEGIEKKVKNIFSCKELLLDMQGTQTNSDEEEDIEEEESDEEDNESDEEEEEEDEDNGENKDNEEDNKKVENEEEDYDTHFEEKESSVISSPISNRIVFSTDNDSINVEDKMDLDLKEGQPENVNIPKLIIDGPVKRKEERKSESVVNKKLDNDSTRIGGDNGEHEVDPKVLVGSLGIQRFMTYKDTKNPPFKGDYEYKDEMLQKYGRIFSPEKIGSYSSKIKSVCDNIYNPKKGTISDGIILIYSAYIDAGLIPMALALEEMGLKRFEAQAKPLFKSPLTEKPNEETMEQSNADSIPEKTMASAKYIMITGDARLSPDNDAAMKAVTEEKNRDGKDIKVVLISQVGSEGLDFKCIRQIHILEPWYSMSRNEQIIGRGIRNSSHKYLPFEERNVQIFMHATILAERPEEETADLYVYRVAEKKAIQMGKVTRLMKETAVDCLLNHSQTDLTADNFRKIKENAKVEQKLSNGLIIDSFPVGDVPNTAACDYMSVCEYKCITDVTKMNDDVNINVKIKDSSLPSLSSNVEDSVLEKIMDRMKTLMKQRHFYKRKDLLGHINVPIKFSKDSINLALSQMINDTEKEIIYDKYGRAGKLVNIGDYYFYQPADKKKTDKSVYDSSATLDTKHEMLRISFNEDAISKGIDSNSKSGITNNVDGNEYTYNEDSKNDLFKDAHLIFEKMREQYNIATGTTTIDDETNGKLIAENDSINRMGTSWYEQCKCAINFLVVKKKLDKMILLDFVTQHILESLSLPEKETLAKFFTLSSKHSEEKLDQKSSRGGLENAAKDYLCEKTLRANRTNGLYLVSGPESAKLLVQKNGIWKVADAEEDEMFASVLSKRYKMPTNVNKYVGYLGYVDKELEQPIQFKLRDTEGDKSQKDKSCSHEMVDEVFYAMNNDKTMFAFNKDKIKMAESELCVIRELLLRYYNHEKRDDKIWFVDAETIVYNDLLDLQ